MKPPPAGARRLAALHIDILIEAGDWPPEDELRVLTDRAVLAALASAEVATAGEAELSVLFTDDDHIRALNRRYRSKDSATNVLSFPAPQPVAGEYGPQMGDIALAAETVAGEAADQGLTLETHLTHLMIHGFLHLIGYDHQTAEQAVVMESLETDILGTLGIADPYAEAGSTVIDR